MTWIVAALAVVTIVLTHSAGVYAQTVAPPEGETRDHAIVYEAGWAGDWSRADGVHAAGGTLAFEVTPIERWLELEAGVAVIKSAAGTEIPVDVLLKKPWRISPRFEFMIGVGPELIHETGAQGSTFWGMSVVADFMFWPRRHVGWYLEPGYEAAFRGGGTQHGLAVAAGVLIGR